MEDNTRKKANADLRNALKEYNVKHWELAEKIGISNGWLSVKLRKELPKPELDNMILAVIEIAIERG